jgi:hypothetical protein
MFSLPLRSAAVLASALCVTVLGCSSPVAPGTQPQITNVADNFQYQTSYVQAYTGSATYTWTNSGTRATINQATTVPGGAMTLTIRDAAGTQVYSSSLVNNGTFTTSPAGVAGSWSIQVDYIGASGTVNFRVQKL